MELTITIPDDLAAQITASGKDPSRVALEALAMDGYRSGRLSENEVRIMLGYQTRMQVHTLLAEHNVDLQYTEEQLRQDIAASDRLRPQRVGH
jgi:hypothetical protein